MGWSISKNLGKVDCDPSVRCPYFTEQQTSFHGLSTNWDGYVFYNPYFYFWRKPITASSAIIDVANIKMPPSNQVDNAVSQITTPWIKLSNGEDGSGGLAQTGYENEENLNSGYYLWFEIFPLPSYEYNDSSNGVPHYVQPGQLIDFTIQQSGSWWNIEAYNYNNSQTYTASVYYPFTAYYAESIVEAPSFTFNISGHLYIQQIAEFSNIYLYRETLYTGGNTYSINYFYNSGDYLTYSLNQYGKSTYNVNHYYIKAYPPIPYTNIYGYTEEEWLIYYTKSYYCNSRMGDGLWEL